MKVEGLSKNFDGLEVLRDVSLRVEPGEKVAIIGPNGAGKTTLFNVLGGQLPASGGEINLLGRKITTLPPHRRLHLGLSRSYQINSLFFALPLLDNMLLAVQGARHPHFRIFRRIDSGAEIFLASKRLLEEMGLWDKRSVPVSNLSYGDQRLLEVA